MNQNHARTIVWNRWGSAETEADFDPTVSGSRGWHAGGIKECGNSPRKSEHVEFAPPGVCTDTLEQRIVDHALEHGRVEFDEDGGMELISHEAAKQRAEGK